MSDNVVHIFGQEVNYEPAKKAGGFVKKHWVKASLLGLIAYTFWLDRPETFTPPSENLEEGRSLISFGQDSVRLTNSEIEELEIIAQHYKDSIKVYDDIIVSDDVIVNVIAGMCTTSLYNSDVRPYVESSQLVKSGLSLNGQMVLKRFDAISERLQELGVPQEKIVPGVLDSHVFIKCGLLDFAKNPAHERMAIIETGQAQRSRRYGTLDRYQHSNFKDVPFGGMLLPNP